MKYKKTALGICTFLIGGFFGYQIGKPNFINLSQVNDNISKIDIIDNNDDFKIVDNSRVITLKTDEGKGFYLIYKDNISSDLKDVRYILGDGYVSYSGSVIKYLDKYNNKKENKTKDSNFVKNTKSNYNNNMRNINNEEKSRVYIEPSISKEEVNSDKNVGKKLTAEDGFSSIENGYSNSENNNINKEVNNSEVSERIKNLDSLISRSGDRKGKNTSERVVDELNFVNNNFSGTTKERIAVKEIPNKEEREKFKKELNDVANDSYKKNAIKKISKTISPFTLDYKSNLDVEKKIITVFTDPTCPYCQKLHKDINKMQDIGYTIRYLLIPRDGMKSPIVDDISYATCLRDEKRKKEVVDKLFSGMPVNKSDKPKYCNDNQVKRQLDLLAGLGAKNTPFIMDNNGGTTQGYTNIKKMINNLDK